MLGSITNLLIVLAKNMCVVIVLAYVLTRTRIFSEVLDKKISFRHRFFLMILFGLFSIYGTLSGMELLGAVANIRDLGPAIAGLYAGPVAGLGAGFIGAIHRYALGGITALPCAVSTVIAGLAGGAIFLLKKDRFVGVPTAMVFAALMEVFHMVLALLLSSPHDQAMAIVKQVSVPMIVANSLGMGVFAFMVSNLIRERETKAAKETIESELRVAREIQMGIVPKIFPAFPDRPEFDIHALLEPAKEVGGDLYDFFLFHDHLLYFVIGDVSGKGVPSSLFMAVTKTLIKAEAGKDHTDPAEILFSVNNELSRDNESCMFVTIFLGMLDIRKGRILFCNGGHNPPYVFHRNGAVEMLPGTGDIALGAMEDVPYHQGSIALEYGDSLVLYTDGVTEAMDKEGNLFTEKRLEAALRKLDHGASREVSLAVFEEVKSFAAGTMQSDDITLLVLKYRASP